MFASLHTNSNLLTSLLASHHTKHILIAEALTLCAFTLNIGQAHTKVHFIHTLMLTHKYTLATRGRYAVMRIGFLSGRGEGEASTMEYLMR